MRVRKWWGKGVGREKWINTFKSHHCGQDNVCIVWSPGTPCAMHVYTSPYTLHIKIEKKKRMSLVAQVSNYKHQDHGQRPPGMHTLLSE